VVAVAVTSSGDRAERFVEEALAQAGDRYVFGKEARLDDPDPAVFDCSELVQWAAHRVGVTVSDGSWLQYLQMQKQGGAISVEEALHTRGALLFYFSTPPTSAGRPGKAHVAISLGDGRTIEARSPSDGVGSFAATAKRFNYAAVIPGLSAAGPTPGADDLPAVPAPDPPSPDTHARAAAYTMPAPPPPDPAPPADAQASGAQASGTQASGTQPSGTQPSGTRPGGDPAQTDTDKDGLTDAFEALLRTDPQKEDTDADGLGDAREVALTHTDPRSPDTDSDGTDDAAEVAAGTDPGTAPLPKEAVDAGLGGSPTRDTDQDGLSDYFERLIGTRADDPDSDSDGVLDGVEKALGSDPTSIDTNRDGLTDDLAYQAGTLGPAPGAAAAVGGPADDPSSSPGTATLPPPLDHPTDPSTLPAAIGDTGTQDAHADPGVADLPHLP
jgi:hypothetical protein